MTLQGVTPRALGGARSEQTTRADLEHYRELALELGASGAARIPVILDTDIGTDIDDTWALAMLLKSPELDVKLVVSDSGDTAYRARIIARMLEIAGRTDVPVGVGIPLESAPRNQASWVAGYDLSRYPGPVHEDGVGAIVDTIMGSPEPVTLIAIGPVPNIAAALAREPKIAERARFVGMHGSVRRGYGGREEVSAEHNVQMYPHACQAVFAARWDVTITPLDTCGIVRLEEKKYRAVRDSDDPLIRALIENYRTWAESCDWAQALDADVQSSVLFDAVAVYLAFSEELLVMEKLGIRVTDDGTTVVDDSARTINCATAWKDLPAFEDFLVQRLTGRR
jgi:inosine-uridine nucleoside N-ribohydrolase